MASGVESAVDVGRIDGDVVAGGGWGVSGLVRKDLLSGKKTWSRGTNRETTMMMDWQTGTGTT